MDSKASAKNLLLALLLLAGVVWLFGHKSIEASLSTVKIASLPVKYVRVEGVFKYLGQEEVQDALLPLVTTGILEADMQAIQQAVANLPWVGTVAVKRVWPDAIEIKVREKKAYARWGEESLITEQGVIFTPSNIDPQRDMIVLMGPDQQQMKVLEIMKGIKTALADQAMGLAEFSVNDRWAWKIKLTTGLEILLGRDGQLKKLQRFLKSLTLLSQEQVDAMAIADLRYPNGFAVSWKPDSAEIDWKSIANPENKPDGHTKKATE
ncbi:MAG: cell division protein FtsQ/DivIB [Methylovulum sp.]|nr:cell division protein FtsQ/DivIB [Methylovulum sp.]